MRQLVLDREGKVSGTLGLSLRVVGNLTSDSLKFVESNSWLILTSVGTSFHAGTVSAAQQVRHPSVPEPPRRANICFASTKKKIRPKKRVPYCSHFAHGNPIILISDLLGQGWGA